MKQKYSAHTFDILMAIYASHWDGTLSSAWTMTDYILDYG